MSGRSRWSSNSSIGRRSGYGSNYNFSNVAPLTKSKDFSDYSSNSSLESGRRSREQSSSREHFLSSYDSNDGPFGPKTENLHSWRSKFAGESRNQQSPTINILQIKLEGGNTRSQQCGLGVQGLKQGSKSSTECCDNCDSVSEDPSSSQKPGNVSEKKSHQRSRSTQPNAKQPAGSCNPPPVSPNGTKTSSQEKLGGQTKSKTSPNSNRPTVNPKEIEKLTSDVDVQKKRQRFEGAAAAKNGGNKAEKPKSQQPEPPPRRKSVKQNWQQVREKHCPVTNQIVNEGNGESLRNSILVSEEKVSFRNIKFKKATHVTVGGEEIKLKEVTSTKAFEDRATAILTEMRKQRRTLQMEYVAKVSTPTAKKITGWRDKLNRSDSLKKEEEKEEVCATGEGYQGGVKRNSLTQLAGKIKRKLSSGKADVGKGWEKAEESNSWRKKDATSESSVAKSVESPSVTIYNPLDFILMKEDFLRKNPTAVPKKSFRRDRSVESDSGETSMASVMDSLKKIVKAINPKREFPSDIARREREEKAKQEAAAAEKARLREEILEKARPNTWTHGYTSSWEVRMRKYQMGANMPTYNKYASRWNSMQDLRIEPECKVVDKKAVRERIQHKVLSSVHQAHQDKIDEIFMDCDIIDFSIRGFQKCKPVSYKSPRMTFQQEAKMVLECVEYRKRELVDIIAHFSKDGEQKKRKSCHVKPVLHGVEKGGKSSEASSYALVVRTDAPWETVKPINVSVKKKTELFDKAPKTPLVPGKAKVLCEPALMVAVTMSPGTCGTTAYCEQHKWDNMKACALFSIVGAAVTAHPVASETRRIVVSLPVSASLADDEGKSGEQIFHKCERKTQADLIQAVLAGHFGSLSRISFHYPATFVYFDTVMTVCRFLRTKKNIKKYKFKQEEVIARVIEGKSSDRRESNSTDDQPFLSYGTV